MQAVYEEVLRAGGLPIMQLTTDGAQSAFFELAGEEQLDWVPPPAEWAAENADVRIAIMADVNARELSQADPKKQARAQKARKGLMETSMSRSAAGEYRWALTLFPTHAYASEAGMSLRDYEDFYYAACLAADSDPRDRLAAPVGRGEPAGRVDRGQGAGAHQGARHRPHARRGGASLDSLRGRAQHARRRVLHRSDRGLGRTARSASRFRRATAGGRCRACASASRTARWWTPRPIRARTS